MAFHKYTSCIKITGCPILPPLMTESRRLELRKDIEEAVKIEHKLSERVNHATISGYDSEMIEPPVSVQSPISENNTSASSTENTGRLMDFIKFALQDVEHTEEVQLLQNQILEELAKLDINKGRDSQAGSCDTLNNLDHLPAEKPSEESSSHCEMFNFSEMENNLPLPAEPCCSRNSSNAFFESDQEFFTPPKLVRRNSYTLQTPSTSVISYLKSLTHQEGEPNSWENSSNMSVKSVSKNLNNFWSDHSVNSQKQDGSEYPELSIMDISNTQLETSFESSMSRDTKMDTRALLKMPLTNSNRMNIDDSITSSQEKAATIIQACVRGYLVRRLLRTNKVVELKKTIKDSLIYALSLHAEQDVTPADINLHIGLIRQVTAACYDLYSIFFEWSVKEKMNLISQDRMKLQIQKPMRIFPSRSSRKHLKRTRSLSSALSNNTDPVLKNSVRCSSYSASSRTSPSLKYQPWK